MLPFLQYYSGKPYEGDFPTENDEKLLDILLYCNSKFNTITNQNILICTLKLTKDLLRYLYSFRTISILLHGLFMTMYFFLLLKLIYSVYFFLFIFSYLINRILDRVLVNVFKVTLCFCVYLLR